MGKKEKDNKNKKKIQNKEDTNRSDDSYMQSDDFDDESSEEEPIKKTSVRKKREKTVEAIVKQYLNKLINQVVINVNGVPDKRVYHLRNRTINSGDINNQNSNDAVIIDKRVLFTYSSPFFSGSIDITEYDYHHLDDGNKINDNIINFYMEYMYTSYMEKQMNNNFSAIQESITSPQITDSSFLHQLHNRFLILNSFFYSRISRSIDISDKEEIASLLKWSAGQKIFEKEFVFIPVFSGNHWTLVILCYANHLYHYIKEGETHFGIDYSQNSKEKVELSTDEKPSFYPCILVLNSLQDAATLLSRKLREYLTLVLHDYDPSITTSLTYLNLPLVIPSVSQQINSIDCGIYVLLFAEKMIEHYGEYDIKCKVQTNKKMMNSLFSFLQFPPSLAVEKRQSIQQIIRMIEKEQTIALSDDSDSFIECIGITYSQKTTKRSRKRRKKEIKESPSKCCKEMDVKSSQMEVERALTQLNTPATPAQMNNPVVQMKIPPITTQMAPPSNQMNTPVAQVNTSPSTQLNTPSSIQITTPSSIQIPPSSTQINTETSQKAIQKQLRKSIYFMKSQSSSSQANPNPPHVLYSQLLPKENQPQNSYQRRIMPNHPFLS